ncbi:large ribosomal subunit protein uL23-like [Sminthopsis crassicaudata]|uniref:large ribosomal subunit protein uL23-like n=1 Tax=Sminthopsis crassicaudata TaxID=9301 RepID=UPI003D69E630
MTGSSVKRRICSLDPLNLQTLPNTDSGRGQQQSAGATSGIRFIVVLSSPESEACKVWTKGATTKLPEIRSLERNELDPYAIMKFSLPPESALRLIFIVDIKTNKQTEKKLYDIDTAQINTPIRPDGKKKACDDLAPDCDVLDGAPKIRIIQTV